MKIAKVDVWAATIKDRPGGLAEKLVPLSKAGANLAFVIARRQADRPGKGVVFVTPIKGGKQIAAAKKAGFKRSRSLRSLVIRGPDRRGLGSKMAAALGQAGINLRGLSAAAVGKEFVAYFAFDKLSDSAKAARILRKI
jgi:ACT domain-containing protein